jgi:DNA polymerase-1
MNNLCHISHYSTGHLANDDDRRTGVIFGVFKHFLSLYKRFGTSNFILCWDSRKSYRKLIYPEYKAQRKRNRTPEQEADRQFLYEQISCLRSNILPEIGFQNSFIQTGYESDDLIAKLTIDYKDSNYRFVIVSTDHDLLQLLSKTNVVVYNTIKKEIYTEKRFLDEWGIPPIEYRSVKSIAGCDSDNIPSIAKGIGEKSALKFILGQGGEELNKKIWDNKHIRELNFKLVALPFKNEEKPLPQFVIRKNKFQTEGFRKWFIKLGFDYFMKNFNEWENFIDSCTNSAGK